jgi:hypothetical protein
MGKRNIENSRIEIHGCWGQWEKKFRMLMSRRSGNPDIHDELIEREKDFLARHTEASTY